MLRNISLQLLLKRATNWVCVFALMFAFLLQSFVITDAKTTYKLSKKSLTLTVGQSKKITLKKAKTSKVKWTTSNKKVAKVKKGKITAVSRGKCTITAKYKKKKYKCNVKVINTSKLNFEELKKSLEAKGEYHDDVNAYFYEVPKTFIDVWYYADSDKLEFWYTTLSTEWGEHRESICMSLVGEEPKQANISYELYDKSMNGTEAIVNEYTATTAFYTDTFTSGIKFTFFPTVDKHTGSIVQNSQYYNGQSCANKFLQDAMVQWNVALEDLTGDIYFYELGFDAFK